MSQVLCIIPGPSHEYKRIADSKLTRWCFGCRRHLPHEQVLYGDPPPKNLDFADWPELDGWAKASIAWPSYYDPIWVTECSNCHKDKTWFGASKW